MKLDTCSNSAFALVRMVGVAAVALFLTVPVWAQNAPPPRSRGYLAPAEVPDLIRIVPAAPAIGDSRDASDRAIFLSTRMFEGTPRWSMAQRDDDVSVTGVLKAFSCAAGSELSAENDPRVTALVSGTLADTIASLNGVKNLYQRKRPFRVDNGPICVALTNPALGGPDYPSGHAAVSWAVGLIFAEMMPARANDILLRARAFGESRIICGVHNASAVEASRTAAAAMVSALHGSEKFRSDLEAAKAELAARLNPAFAAADSCKAESATVAITPYSGH